MAGWDEPSYFLPRTTRWPLRIVVLGAASLRQAALDPKPLLFPRELDFLAGALLPPWVLLPPWWNSRPWADDWPCVPAARWKFQDLLRCAALAIHCGSPPHRSRILESQS